MKTLTTDSKMPSSSLKILTLIIFIVSLTGCGGSNSTPLISQSIDFAQVGPFNLLIGDTQSNIASGGDGSGAITYSSNDPDVTTVDNAGLLTAVGAGNTTITAAKVADTQYAAASASFPINGSKQAALTVSLAHFSERAGHQVVTFNNQLWLIGGDHGGPTNDVWSSSDGITWSEQTANASFSARYFHQVVTFNNQLWLIGGDDLTNDVWSSSDGINWIERTTSAAFSARYFHQVVTFNNQLWLLGGCDGSPKSDVWSSSDGINWSEQTTSAAFSARDFHQVVTFNNQLWLIGGDGDDSGRTNDVWSSSDGINWSEQTTSAAFSARDFHQVVTFNNQLWLIGGYDVNDYNNDVWFSSDGINWRTGYRYTFKFQ